MKIPRIGWALAAFALALAFGLLGAWQLERAREKTSMIEAATTARTRPIQVLDILGELGPSRPVRVEASGTYDATRELLLDNQTSMGRSGVSVLTPFRVYSTGEVLLVDRGWLAVDPATRRPPRITLPPAGLMRVRGLLTPLPGVGIRMGDANIQFTPAGARPLLAWLDQAALDDAFDAPVVAGLLRLDAAQAGGFLREWSPVPTTMPPVRHRGYALQWFALSFTVLVTWLLLAFRRR